MFKKVRILIKAITLFVLVFPFFYGCSPKMSHSQRKKESSCRLKLCYIHLEIVSQMIDSPEATNIQEIIKEIKRRKKDFLIDKKDGLLFVVNPNFSKWKNAEKYEEEDEEIAICCKVGFYPPSRNIHYVGIGFDGKTFEKFKEPPHWYKAAKKPTPPKKEENSSGKLGQPPADD